MSVQGSLRTMPAADVLEWIDRRKLCGTLAVERGALGRKLHADSGYLTFASSTAPGEQLGNLLLARGLVSDEALREAFRVQGETGVLLGKILLLTGSIDEAALGAVLEGKIREAVCDLLTWTDGTFSLVPGHNSEPVDHPVAVELAGALAEGLAQAPRRREIDALLPHDDLVFWLIDRERLGQAALDEPTRRVAERAAAGKTINQIVLELDGDRFAVRARLVELVERGHLRLDRRARRRQASNSQLDAVELAGAVRGRARGGDRAGAFDLARRGLEEHPEDGGLRDAYRELERALVAELSRELLIDFRVPRLARPVAELDGLELDDAERYLAGRVDGRWDLLSILRIAPLRQIDTLMAFRRLAERGIITW